MIMSHTAVEGTRNFDPLEFFNICLNLSTLALSISSPSKCDYRD